MAIHSQLILFSLLSTYLLCAFGLGAKDGKKFRVIKLTSLLPSPLCSTPKGSNHHENQKGMLKLDHHYGPCSPFGHHGKPNLRQILSQDQSRVNSLQTRLFKARVHHVEETKTTTLPAQMGVSVGTLNYIITIGLGTPKSELRVVFDTGSNLNWVQCQPCAVQCYPQQDPIFNPLNSSTYLNISCASPDCSQLSSATGFSPRCSSASTCVYTTTYGDGSVSLGYFARETLSLTPSDIFPNFAFGCGQANKGLFGRAAGLLGLGRNTLSLVSQTAKEYGKVFSYCLPSTSSSNGGYLKFGAGDVPSVKFTPMLTNPTDNSLYFLQMVGISVGAQQLNIAPSTFASPGTIIDSGTIITRLPMSAYIALRSTFRQFMSNYTMAPEFAPFDTCYDFSGKDTMTLPKVVLHFGGDVEVEVATSGIFAFVNPSQTCLAFAGNNDTSDVSIIGNHQQQTFQVIYDLTGEKVGFGAAGCS
ncbi:aspartyl protease family protein At5g10770-like [Tasmannia lanceolata]|uniref:aspartyl protease family protein At5g10770-like n=1 Tax=Tasmannia lanceolata TaxID=3420 RepID=UPI004062A57F